MPVETPAADLVRQLSRVGLRPDERLVGHILDHGEEARAELLRLATNLPALHGELPASLGPLHALRLLGELPDVSMIAPLLAALPVPILNPEGDVPAQLYATEVLQIIGRVGAPAVEPLWSIADDASQSVAARGSAINALAFVVTYAPERRDEVVAEARRRMAQEDVDPVVLAGVVSLLAEVGDAESYRPVMAAFRSGKLDQSRIPAAAARQLMLGGGRKDLSCVNHPLWERYEQHGPNFQTKSQ